MDRLARGEQLAVRYSGPFGEIDRSNAISQNAVAFVGGGIAVGSCLLLRTSFHQWTSSRSHFSLQEAHQAP